MTYTSGQSDKSFVEFEKSARQMPLTCSSRPSGSAHWSQKLKRENEELKQCLTRLQKVLDEKEEDEKKPNDPDGGSSDDEEGETFKFISVVVKVFYPDELRQSFQARVFDNDQTFRQMKFQIEGMTDISAFKLRLHKTESVLGEEFNDDEQVMDNINVNPLRPPTELFVEVFDINKQEVRHVMTISEHFMGKRKRLNISVSSLMTFNDLEFILQGKYGISSSDLSLRPEPKEPTEEEVMALMAEHTNLELSVRGRGGVVKKTILKNKSQCKTQQCDRQVYENAFTTALQVFQSSAFSLKEAVGNMSVESVRALKTYLKEDRATKKAKFQRLHEFIDEYKKLSNAHIKIESAMEELQKWVMSDLESIFVENGDISMEMVKEMVSNSLAIKESSGSGDTSMR